MKKVEIFNQLIKDNEKVNKKTIDLGIDIVMRFRVIEPALPKNELDLLRENIAILFFKDITTDIFIKLINQLESLSQEFFRSVQSEISLFLINIFELTGNTLKRKDKENFYDTLILLFYKFEVQLELLENFDSPSLLGKFMLFSRFFRKIFSTQRRESREIRIV